MNHSSTTKAERSRNLRYKRPALESMSYSDVCDEVNEICEKCSDIHWWTDTDEDTLLNALDGDEEDAWEFRMAFSALEAKSDRLQNELYDYGMPDEQTFDDYTVALIGNRYRAVGYDDYEEDYFSLTAYEENLAETEAGKRLMRLTKKDMISTIGQCFGILMAYYDIRQQYDYLQATFDILRDQNTSLLDTIKEIDKLYASADAEGWNGFSEIEKRFDKLLDTLPDDIWII